jgi:hypothetical protein
MWTGDVRQRGETGHSADGNPPCVPLGWDLARPLVEAKRSAGASSTVDGFVPEPQNVLSKVDEFVPGTTSWCLPSSVSRTVRTLLEPVGSIQNLMDLKDDPAHVSLRKRSAQLVRSPKLMDLYQKPRIFCLKLTDLYQEPRRLT